MSRWTEKLVLIFNDIVSLNLALYIVYLFNVEGPLSLKNYFFSSVALTVSWLLILPFFGVYRSKFAVSRTDELLNLFKAATFGVLLLFVFISLDPEEAIKLRFTILLYWGLVTLIMSLNRILVRTYQKNRLRKGVGQRKTIIIGTGKRAKEAYDRIKKHPIIGFDVKGFIQIADEVVPGIPESLIVGSMEKYKDFCAEVKVEDVLILPEDTSKRKLFELVDMCDGYPVTLMTIPDIFSIAIGNARVENIFGLQLVDILPENYSIGLRIFKRTLDIVFSVLVIFLFLPFWIIVGVAIRLSSEGPIFYRQERVGLHGEPFVIYKFRSMFQDAEKHSGPTLADKNDNRITPVGNILRKLRIDEIPQVINILEGDMSLIGPRPERQFYVDKFLKEIPLYSQRFRVKPGLTGWAQIKQRYEEAATDVNKKLEYDLFYIENMSLKMEITIFLSTVYTVLARHGG